MNSRAYVVLETEQGAADDVASRLQRHKLVSMVNAVDGEDSVIAVFEADDASDLASAVFITARRTVGVVRTTVYLARELREESYNDVQAS